MDTNKEKIPVKWSVMILEKMFEVSAISMAEAKKLASHLYIETVSSKYPLSFLRASARVRCHSDGRIKFNASSFLDSTPNIETFMEVSMKRGEGKTA